MPNGIAAGANFEAPWMQRLARWAQAIGRIAIGVMFLWSGAGKFGAIDQTVGYMHAYGMPASAALAWIAALIEFVGGIMLIVGWRTRWVAAVLFVFTLVASVVFHAYWSAPAGEAMAQQINFMKNVAIMGGLLLLFCYGSGSFALERR